MTLFAPCAPDLMLLGAWSTPGSSGDPMRKRDLSDLCSRAVAVCGVASQISQAMEECAELITVLNQHYFRGRKTVAEVADEIADVEIMCGQLRAMVGDTLVDLAVAQKADRLEARLNEMEGTWAKQA